MFECALHVFKKTIKKTINLIKLLLVYMYLRKLLQYIKVRI